MRARRRVRSWKPVVSGPGGPVDRVDDDRVRGLAGADRRDGVLPPYAHAGRVARPAGVGGCADAAVGGWVDRGRVDHAAGRLARGGERRGAALGAAGRGQRGEPGRQRCRRPANCGRAGDRGVAVVRAYRCLRVAHAPSSPQRSRPGQAGIGWRASRSPRPPPGHHRARALAHNPHQPPPSSSSISRTRRRSVTDPVSGVITHRRSAQPGKLDLLRH
jgi:hypothetical protein